MPYSKDKPPDKIKDMPDKAQEIWISAYNSALDSYDPDKTKDESAEEYANKVAYSAVKEKYHQDKDDKWVLNEAIEEGKVEEVKGVKELVEALQSKITKALDEVGKRNAKKDEDRLLAIQKLVSELLSTIQEPTVNENEVKSTLETYDKEVSAKLDEWMGNSLEGSFEKKRDKIYQALQTLAPKDGGINIEATFTDSVIFNKWGKNYDMNNYWKIAYSEDAKGDITLNGEAIPIEMMTVIKTVNEAKNKLLWCNEKMKKGNLFEGRKPHQINETITLKDYIILDEQKDDKGKTKFLKVKFPVAQVADIKNENDRVYSPEVLEESVKKQKVLAEAQSLTMYDTHPNGQGKVADIIAKINEINYHIDTKTVSLDEVEFIGTSTGADCMEVIKAGIPLQVSQRGTGYSTTRQVNGKPIEFVESLQVYGYDLLPPGQASVQDSGNKVFILSESKDGGKTKMELTKEELATMLKEAKDEAIAQANESTKALLEARKGEFDEIATFKAERAAQKQLDENKQAVEAKIKDEATKWSRFAEPQKKIILESLDYSGTKEDAIKRLDEKMALVDSVRAQAKLEAVGYRGTGVTHIEVGDSVIPGAERITKLNEAVRSDLKMSETLPRQASDRVKSFTQEVLAKFDRTYANELLMEANTMGASNLPTVIQYSRVVLEQAFQEITAFDLCELGMMDISPFKVPIETYSENPRAKINSLKVAQGGTMAKSALTVTDYSLYSETLKLRIGLYEEARIAAKSANYSIEGKSIAALVKDFARRIDQYIYNLMIAKADTYSTAKVTTEETLTQIGATTKWYSIHGGQNYLTNPTSATAKKNQHDVWVKNELIKTFDTNGNLGSTGVYLVGTEATSTLQKVEVKDSSAVPKTLVFGFLQSDGSVRVTENDLTSALADYYVLYADGAIVIADSPVTAGLTGPYKAKYTYSKNARVWMMTPPTGVLFEDHLKTLHQMTGQVKAQLIGSRFWTPNFLAGSISTLDMVSNSALYQQAGSNIANAINADGWIERFAGLVPTKSAIIPDEKMIVGLKGSVMYYDHDSYRIKGPIATQGVAEDEYQALQTTAIDCPLGEKLATVAIGQ